MKAIRDPEQVKSCYEKHHGEQYFELPPSAFHLRIYEEGELLSSPLRPMDHLLLLLEGKLHLYDLNQHGRQLPLGAASGVLLLGDMEFATGTETMFYAHAQSQILCLALPIEPNRQALNKDVTFLHFLIQSLAKKILFQSTIEIPSATIEEKVLRYLETSPSHRIDGIESTALVLRCSKRQLLRTLKKLCEAGAVKKIGHGAYKLCPGRSIDGSQTLDE